MNPNPITASRIKQLREKKGMTQDEFCSSFSEFIGRDTVIAVMSVSNWETGRKLPTTDTMIWLARYYGVSTDYLLGLSNDGEEILTPKAESGANIQIEVPFNELSKHDGEALFVRFPNDQYRSQMALLDYKNKILVMLDYKVKLNERCQYFITMPPEAVTIRNQIYHFLNLKDVMRMERVYIESLSPDPYIQGQINGWYKNDVSGKFLINDAGRTLSYEGLGITYNAIEFKTTRKAID